jgi:dipeptidase E
MRLYLSSYRLGKNPDKFTALLGDNKRVAIIPNAGDGAKGTGRHEWLARETTSLQDLGLEVDVLDLKDYFDGSGNLLDTLNTYGGLWVLGGNSFNLRRAFRQSGLDQILPSLIADDKLVYAGFSAGAIMPAPSLRGVELVDPPNEIPAGYNADIIWEGLGILPYAVAPHYKSDHPESAAIDTSVEYLIDHHLPFVALRDGEEIIWNGDDKIITSL